MTAGAKTCERGDDRAVHAYRVGLDGAEDDAFDERGGLELVGKASSHSRMIVGVADGFMAGTVMLENRISVEAPEAGKTPACLPGHWLR